MDIARNLSEVKRRIARAADKAGRSPDEITIIAVTKTIAIPAIEAAIDAGIEHFGENRVQEAEDKIVKLIASGRRPIWHMIGHLQRNKVKTALDIFDIIHSIDSLRLAQSVSAQANISVPVLLEVNIADEETKSGFPAGGLPEAVAEISRLPNLSVKGLMTVAPFVSDAEEVRPVFRELRKLRDTLGLEHLSMGMSDDFEVAIEEGATMVRLGRIIFGERF
ncbi:MAG: YggS family pyridoxal phosphate-dependent enzyme [Chloroflexota bacterium]|nr:YggS family pyridoxal phosphate-dependent enzyme [Chloroflexota bacterium]